MLISLAVFEIFSGSLVTLLALKEVVANFYLVAILNKQMLFNQKTVLMIEVTLFSL